MIRFDGEAGVLEALVDPAEWNARTPARDTTPSAWDLGRSLFAVNRRVATPADEGALSISCGAPWHDEPHAPEYDAEYQLGRTPEAALAPHEAKDA